MPDRIVTNEYEHSQLLKFIEGQKPPFTVSITAGKHRTTEQNRLQRKWMTEAADQFGDRTAEDVRGYCKLHFGVPILRRENEAFRERYDEVVKPLTYEQKLKIMMEPLDMPITRIMTTKQKTAYLDDIFRALSEEGIVLTLPEDKRYGAAA